MFITVVFIFVVSILGIVVEGLSEEEINTTTEAKNLLNFGRNKLIVAETKMVRFSSRYANKLVSSNQSLALDYWMLLQKLSFAILLLLFLTTITSSSSQLFFPYTAGSIINRWQYQFFTENSEFPKFRNSDIFAVHNPHQDTPLAPKSYLYDLSYALLVVNLKNNIFCLDYL